MKIFIDTANIEEIKEAASWGVLDGVTTNPSLIAKEGKELKSVISDICNLVDGPISAEVISLESEKMVEEAVELAKLHKNIVIKIPMCIEGLKAVNILSEKGIKTNVTLIFSSQQALMAAKAGASYVSPFVGRLDDIGKNGVELIKEVADIFNVHGIKTEIISASIRNPIHVSHCALVGSNIATIPFNVLKQMTVHPLTNSGIEKFLSDYNNNLK